MTESVAQTIGLQNRMFEWSVNNKDKMKLSQPYVKYHPEIYLEELRKTTKKVQDDQSPGCDLDPDLNKKQECQQYNQQVRWCPYQSVKMIHIKIQDPC